MVLQPPVSDVPGLIRIVAAVIRDAAGRVLLVRKRGAAVFQQPGGKRDPGDADDVATLARELREELGVALVAGSVRHLWTGRLAMPRAWLTRSVPRAAASTASSPSPSVAPWCAATSSRPSSSATAARSSGSPSR